MNGQFLGSRYHITRVLAQGGFGQTYLAIDTHRPGHPVCVVKQLRPTKQKPELMQKIQLWFKNEAEILEKLGLHDRIPQLLAYFEEDDEFYLVQEYVPGNTLNQELVVGAPWESKSVVQLLIDILDILKFVHSYGVIHRDVKPSNIIRRATDGRLVLIDFGTVKQIPPLDEEGTPNLTLAVGTPAYMPIEQLYGYPKLNSDIYATGVIGIQAASGLSAQEVKTLIDPNSPHAALRNWRDLIQVSPAIADILEKMVQPDHRQRYQTVEAVLSDLMSLDESRSSISTHPTIPVSGNFEAKTARTASTKSSYLLKLFPIAGVLAIALGAGFYYISLSRTPQNSALENITEKNFTFARALSGHSSFVWSVALSADGQTLASGSEDNTIRIWHPSSGKLNHILTSHLENVRAVTLSADGQMLASGSGDNTIKIWHTRTGELLKTLTGHSEPVWSVTLSRDGQTLVSGSQDKTIKVWNVRTGELLRTIPGHNAAVFALALTPDGLTLVSASQDKTIKIWNVQTGQLSRTLKGHADAVRAVAISPDGQSFASGSWDNTIKIWNITTGELVRTIAGHSDRVVSVAYSFDNQTLATASVDKTIKIWDLNTGELYQTLSGHSDWVLSIAMSSWGHILVSSSRDQTIRIWK